MLIGTHMWRIYRYRFPWPWATGSRGVIFQMDLFNNVRTVWPRTTKFGRKTHVVEGRICRGSATPLPQGGGPNRNPILVVLSIDAHTLWCRTTKFDVATNMGGVLFLMVSHTTTQKGAGCTRCRRTTNFDVVTYGGGGVSWCQPRLPS